MNANDPVIVSAVRTPIGSFGGAFKNQPHTHLASIVMNEVCKRVHFPKDKIEDIFWGIVMQHTGPCDENGLARGAALKAGIPEETSAAQIKPGMLFQAWMPFASVRKPSV